MKKFIALLLLLPLTITAAPVTMTFSWTPPAKDIKGSPTTLTSQAVKCGTSSGTYPYAATTNGTATSLSAPLLTLDSYNYCVYTATNADGTASTGEYRFFLDQSGTIVPLVPDVSGVGLKANK
jgi:hypothetical protein